jgi:hypothetical protein
MVWDGNKPGTLPRVTDDRLTELAADRTAFEAMTGARPMTDLELLAVVDELRAWRKYKLTDAEKAALDVLREAFCETGDRHDIAWATIDRLTGRDRRNG